MLKFNVSSKTNLTDVMKELGITDVFEQHTADFSPLSDDTDIYVDKAEHAAMVEIDEHIECFRGLQNTDAEEAVVEELIEQHADLAALYPRAINTLRVVTMNRRVIGAALRMGAGGNCVDNTSAGGVYAGIDVDSGIVVSRALNHLGERFVRHPDTGVVIPGFKIPYWRESLSLIEDAVPLTVGVPLIGWDIAITASGPTLVEVNTHPGMWTMQAPLGIGYKRLIFDVQPELLQRP